MKLQSIASSPTESPSSQTNTWSKVQAAALRIKEAAKEQANKFMPPTVNFGAFSPAKRRERSSNQTQGDVTPAPAERPICQNSFQKLSSMSYRSPNRKETCQVKVKDVGATVDEEESARTLLSLRNALSNYKRSRDKIPISQRKQLSLSLSSLSSSTPSPKAENPIPSKRPEFAYALSLSPSPPSTSRMNDKSTRISRALALLDRKRIIPMNGSKKTKRSSFTKSQMWAEESEEFDFVGGKVDRASGSESDLFESCFNGRRRKMIHDRTLSTSFDEREESELFVTDESENPAEEDTIPDTMPELRNEVDESVQELARGILRAKSKKLLSSPTSKRERETSVRFDDLETSRTPPAPCGYELDPEVKEMLWFSRQERMARRQEDRLLGLKDQTVKSYVDNSELLYNDLEEDGGDSTPSKDLFHQCWLQRQSDDLWKSSLSEGLNEGHRGLECANPIIAKQRRERVREHIAVVVATSQCTVDGKPVSSERLKEESEFLSAKCKTVALRWGYLDARAAGIPFKAGKAASSSDMTNTNCSDNSEGTIFLEL